MKQILFVSTSNTYCILLIQGNTLFKHVVFVPLLNFHQLVLKNMSIYIKKKDQIGFLSLDIVIIKLWIHDYITFCYYYVL